MLTIGFEVEKGKELETLIWRRMQQIPRLDLET